MNVRSCWLALKLKGKGGKLENNSPNRLKGMLKFRLVCIVDFVLDLIRPMSGCLFCAVLMPMSTHLGSAQCKFCVFETLLAFAVLTYCSLQGLELAATAVLARAGFFCIQVCKNEVYLNRALAG